MRPETKAKLYSLIKKGGIYLAVFIAGAAINASAQQPVVETKTVVLTRNVEVPGPTVSTIAVPESDACHRLAQTSTQFADASVAYTAQRAELKRIMHDLSANTPDNQIDLNKLKKRLDDLTASTESSDQELAELSIDLKNQAQECQG